MGALTNNRKRGNDYFNLNFKTLAPPAFPNFNHVSKKPRLSSFSNQNPVPKPAKSSVSRFFLYPASITPIRREVHAPCRQIRFRSNSSSHINYKEGSAPQMGNVLSRQFDRAKIGEIHTLRDLKKDKEVIDIDDETAKEGASGDSSNEQVEARGQGRAKRVLSLSRGQEPMETDGVVEILDSFDGKDVERNFQPSYSSAVTGLNDAILKVETAGKILDSLSVVNRPSYSSYLPLYKQLLGTAEKRNDNLKQLQFQIEVNEKLRETYKLLRPQKKEELIKEDLITEPFVPLTKEEETEVSRALSNSNRRRILVTHENSNIDITGEILQCLRPGAWLNDEVINVYLELLKEREKREPKKFLKCHFFNTFFYKKLLSGRGGYNYQSVRRWTSQRKLGYCLLECDKIFVPIHKEIHWCLAVINVKDEKFQYLDSLGVMDTQVLKLLARYFADEVKDKSGKEVDFSSWKQESVEDLPEQMNGYDCGMFMIKYADFYSRGIGLCFNQEHMPYFRSRTAKELLSLKAE